MITPTLFHVSRRAACLVAFATVSVHAQQIRSIAPQGKRQVAVTANADGRAVLQWTFDDRENSIWTSLGDSRSSSRGRVSFLAPRHEGLKPRFRVIDDQPATPGSDLFRTNVIRTLKIEISKPDLKVMRKNLPMIQGAGDGDGGTIILGEEIPRDQLDPDESQVEAIDPDDTPIVQDNEPIHSYVPAVIELDGGAQGRVGIRIKGNSSLVNALIDKRKNYPFKVDVNYFKAGQTIDGIRKFNLHPVVSKKDTRRKPGDPPYVVLGDRGLEDHLSYGALRAFGIPASRTAWMDVYLNGKYLGLYTVVEEIDTAFMQRNFGSPGGNTYKPESEYLEWKGRNYEKYQGLNWNGGTDTKHTSILNLIEVINRRPVTQFQKVIDVQSILNYTAGNVALGNWDTYEALGHNYILHEAVPGRFYVIPWDMNLSQGNEPSNGSLYGKSSPVIGIPEEELPTYPLTDRLYKRKEYDNQYRTTLRAFIEGPGSRSALNARIDDAVALLGTRLQNDAIISLKSDIETRIQKIKKLLNEPTPP